MHILLKHSNIHKGILIITHKEINNKSLINYLTTIKNFYFFICHNGCVNYPIYHTIINYYLTTRSLKNNINKLFGPNWKIPIFNFTSRNFIDNVFNNDPNELIYNNFKMILKKYKLNFNYNPMEKIFDFICVNRTDKIKKTLELYKYMYSYVKNTNKKGCFIIIEDDINNPYYKKIIDFQKKNNSNNILFINGVNLNNFKTNIFTGLTREELAILYKLSKIYMHGCEEEGESRTIHEALCCGCMILAKENMEGGGLDYLNDNNSLLYNHNNYLQKMSEIIINYKNYKFDIDLFNKLNSTHSSNTFLKLLFTKLKYEKFINFEDFKNKSNVTNLMDKLPGHDISVPWHIENCKWKSSDIKTFDQIKILDKYLKK